MLGRDDRVDGLVRELVEVLALQIVWAVVILEFARVFHAKLVPAHRQHRARHDALVLP